MFYGQLSAPGGIGPSAKSWPGANAAAPDRLPPAQERCI